VRTIRWWAALATITAIAAAAYVARSTILDLIILPTAYLLWQVRSLLAGIAQLILWGILVSVTGLVALWQLVPRLMSSPGHALEIQLREGPVQATANHLLRARSSNYFRWQLAHRLARAARECAELYGGADSKVPDDIGRYFDAGMNHSFVEYSAKAGPFTRPGAGPLDLDPAQAVRYLESRFMQGGGTYADIT
jgi:hypothetical protein